MGGELVVSALHAGFGLFGLFYLSVAYLFPTWFCEHLLEDQVVRSKKYPLLQPSTTKRVIWAVLVFGGVGTVIYAAVWPVAQFIPMDWGMIDEDGEWNAARAALQSLSAIFGTVLILPNIERKCAILAARD